MRAAGIEPGRRVYDLCHSYATFSLAAGVSLVLALAADGNLRRDDRPDVRPPGGFEQGRAAILFGSPKGMWWQAADVQRADEEAVAAKRREQKARAAFAGVAYRINRCNRTFNDSDRCHCQTRARAARRRVALGGTVCWRHNKVSVVVAACSGVVASALTLLATLIRRDAGPDTKSGRGRERRE